MKQLITLCIIFFCFLHLKGVAQKSAFNQSDSIHVSGRIAGYTPSEDNNYLTFSTYNINGKSKKTSFPVNSDGTFDFKIFQAFEGDIECSFRNTFIPLFASPGEHLQLELHLDKIDGIKLNKGALIAKGKHAEINNLMIQFRAEYDLHTFQKKARLGDKSQTDSAFAASTMLLLDEKLTFLEDFINRNNVKDSDFKTWQRNQLTYSAGYEILINPFLGKLNTNITEKQLLGLIKGIPITNESAFCNSSYYSFLSQLAAGVEIIININTAYDEIRKSMGYNPLPLYLDRYDALSAGLTRQLMYYSIFSRTSKRGSLALDPSYERISLTTTDPYLNKLLTESIKTQADGFKSYSLIQRIQNSALKEELKQNLLSKFRSGSSFFIDFWGDWCAPCMGEMPNYPKLIAAFNGKPLNFMFFSVSTSQNSMLAVKNKFGIKADFINLNNDEAAIMNNILEFQSYPSHFLVDNTGNVVTKQLPHISNDTGLEASKKMIQTVLKW